MALLITLLKDIFLGILIMTIAFVGIYYTLFLLSFFSRIFGLDTAANFFTRIRNGLTKKIKSFFRKDV